MKPADYVFKQIKTYSINSLVVRLITTKGSHLLMQCWEPITLFVRLYMYIYIHK